MEAQRIRYIKLKNPIGNGWVVRIHIGWKGFDVKEEQGILTRKENGTSGTWKSKDDICVGAERTVDLNDMDIPDEAEVWLIPSVVAGKNGPDSPHYIYSKTAAEMKKFKISGALGGKKTLTEI